MPTNYSDQGEWLQQTPAGRQAEGVPPCSLEENLCQFTGRGMEPALCLTQYPHPMKGNIQTRAQQSTLPPAPEPVEATAATQDQVHLQGPERAKMKAKFPSWGQVEVFLMGKWGVVKGSKGKGSQKWGEAS